MRLVGNRTAQVTAPLLLAAIAKLAGFTLTFPLACMEQLVVLVLVAHLAPTFDHAERENGDQAG